MRPKPRFEAQPHAFWANVRLIGQLLGFAHRRGPDDPVGMPKRHSAEAICTAFADAGHGLTHLGSPEEPSQLLRDLVDYFEVRADLLGNHVEPHLMDADEAKERFDALKKHLNPKCPLPMNKQKGKKRRPAYLTGIVNMIVESNADGLECDYDPRQPVVVTEDKHPLRTFARRLDGAFPSAQDPIAVWEIKEYYHTTTFGSRVADGVYETMLDVMEFKELESATGHRIEHILILDSHRTWWWDGRAYLCRIVDMLHMGLVDEVIFGREVFTRLPELVRGWVERA